MRWYALAIAPILVLGSSAYAAEKENFSGKNVDWTILSQTTSNIPGQQGQMSQVSETFRFEDSAGPYKNAIAAAIEQDEMVGNEIRAKGHGMSRNPNGEETYFSWTGTNKVNGKEISGQGQFEWTGGKGQYANMKGGGTYTCSGPFDPSSPQPLSKVTCPWQGQAELSK
jgi:hypothetical protein